MHHQDAIESVLYRHYSDDEFQVKVEPSDDSGTIFGDNDSDYGTKKS